MDSLPPSAPKVSAAAAAKQMDRGGNALWEEATGGGLDGEGVVFWVDFETTLKQQVEAALREAGARGGALKPLGVPASYLQFKLPWNDSSDVAWVLEELVHSGRVVKRDWRKIPSLADLEPTYSLTRISK